MNEHERSEKTRTDTAADILRQIDQLEKERQGTGLTAFEDALKKVRSLASSALDQA
jgi:hypothetical protein